MAAYWDDYNRVLEQAKHSQHVWRLERDGSIDTGAWEPVDEYGRGIHSGPACRECLYHFCVWCVSERLEHLEEECAYYGWDDHED